MSDLNSSSCDYFFSIFPIPGALKGSWPGRKVLRPSGSYELLLKKNGEERREGDVLVRIV